MTRENVEIVRRLQEAFEAGVEAGDFGAAWDTGLLTEDAEFVPAPEVPVEAGQATYRGREEFAEFMRGGRIVRTRLYLDPDDALEAAGLSE